MSKKETEILIESVGDCTFTITECAKSLDYHVQIVEDQAGYIKQLKRKNKTLRKRVAELEESCEVMCEVEKNLRRKLEAKNELR